MKQFFAFTMAIFMLGLSVQNALLIVSFKINQQYIASAFCENRNTTDEKVCNGSCYLEDQLVESNDTGESEKLPALKEVKETVLFFNAAAILITGNDDRQSLFALTINESIPTGYLSGVFHPPQV